MVRVHLKYFLLIDKKIEFIHYQKVNSENSNQYCFSTKLIILSLVNKFMSHY
jgi:hypothetical protein